jgi:hypothetical protein
MEMAKTEYSEAIAILLLLTIITAAAATIIIFNINLI